MSRQRNNSQRATCEEYNGQGGCGADIFWAVTHKGSKIQMDVEPGTTDDHKWGREKTEDGFDVWILNDSDEGPAFRCHWDSCPNRERKSGNGSSRGSSGGSSRRSGGVSRGSSGTPAPSADAIEGSFIMNGVTYHGWFRPVGAPAASNDAGDM